MKWKPWIVNPAVRRDDGEPVVKTIRTRIIAAIGRMSWAYLAVLTALWIFLRVEGDRWWLATLILFGPIWVTTLPLLVLVPGALVLRRRSLLVLLAATWVAIFPLMGFCIPWRGPFQAKAVHHQRLRLLTCNVHGRALLMELIEQYHPDVVVLQEWPKNSLSAIARDSAWHIRADGELLIASRYPILATHDLSEKSWAKWGGSAVQYELAGPDGTLQLFNVHLASPHRPFESVAQAKPGAVQHLGVYLDMRARQAQKISNIASTLGPDVLLAGDFNTLCAGRTHHDSWTTFNDAFETRGLGLGHTYFAHGSSVRIDHIFSGSAWRIEKCQVGPQVGSPHHPVIAELER